MKKHRIFNKGDIVYCLLSSFNTPDSLIPVRGFIVDTKWDPINPKYKIRLVKIYDNMVYLKKYFFDMKFHHDFGDRARELPIKANDFKSVHELELFFKENRRDNLLIVVDSLMCTKTRIQLNELYNRVQFYLISKYLKQIKTISSRPFYTGHMNVDSTQEFDKKFKKSWESKFEETGLDIDKYLTSLE